MSGVTLGVANLMLANGAPAGTATLMRDGDGFAVAVRAMGLKPGAKGSTYTQPAAARHRTSQARAVISIPAIAVTDGSIPKVRISAI